MPTYRTADPLVPLDPGDALDLLVADGGLYGLDGGDGKGRERPRLAQPRRVTSKHPHLSREAFR